MSSSAVSLEVPETYERLIFVLEGYARHTPSLWESVSTPEQAERWIETTIKNITEAELKEAESFHEAAARHDLMLSLTEDDAFKGIFPSGFFDEIDPLDEEENTFDEAKDHLRAVVKKLANGQVQKLAILGAVLSEIDAIAAHINDAPLSSCITDEQGARDWVNRIFKVFGADVLKTAKEG